MWLGPKLTALSDYLFRTFFRLIFRYDIFISYARRDGKDYAFKLRDQLKQLDFSCFLDFDELPVGNSLNSTLRRALRRSATLVLVGTERAVASPYVALEVNEFASTGRKIIPIDMEGTLDAAPWAVIGERDIVWIDETRAALERGVPSPIVADQIDRLFKYTRRNSRVRAQVLATLGLFIVVVAASLFLIQRQVSAATRAAAEADRQREAALVQKRAADDASALAEERRLEAEAATESARRAQGAAEEALKKVAVAEKAAGVATAEARRQEQAALASAARAREEQQRAEAERARAEEGTRYVQSQSAGVHAALELEGGGGLEQSALLAVESLKKSLTPEGYSAWERATGLLPRALPAVPALAGERVVTAVAYSPEGSWLAAGVEGGVSLHTLSGGGEPVRLRLRRGGGVSKISFARKGELAALAGEGYFELWDVRGRKHLMSLEGFYTGSVAVSPDGRYVAAVGPEHFPRVQVFDTAAPAEALFDVEVKGHKHSMSAAWSPDGRWLAAAFGGGKVLVWDASAVAAGAKPEPSALGFASEDERPLHLAFGPRGTLGIVSESRGGMMLTGWRLWLNEGVLNHRENFRVPVPPSGQIVLWSMAFSPDDAYVALASKDQTARVWETVSGREVARRAYDKEVDSVAFSHDGRTLTAVSGGVADSWKTEFGPAAVRLEHADDVKGVAVSPGGEWLVTAGEGGARLFRTSDWSELKTLDAVKRASSVVFSPDGLWLAVGGEEQAAVFDTRTWEAVKTFDPLERKASLGFSPDGRWLLLANGNSLKLLEPNSWREARAFEHSDPVSEVSFSPDGQRLYVVAEGSYRWGITRRFDRRERAYVWGLGGSLAACGTIVDEYARNVKESESGQEMPEHARTAYAVPCPDVEGHASETLFAEARSWEKVPKSGGGRPSSPDGLWLVEDARDSEIHLSFKEGNTRRKVATLTRRGSAEGWAFTPDSRWLVVIDGPSVKPWPLKQPDLVAETCARLRRRDLPAEVWQKYFSGEKSEPTCAP